MIPRLAVEVETWLPDGELWLPDLDDLDVDGFGYFQDTWLIVGTTEADVESVLASERRCLIEADRSSATPADFDAACLSLEFPEEDVGDTFGGLEIGVTGLCHVLNFVGAGTAASCRGHVGPTAWSARPVVYLAADRDRAEAIGRVASESHCGLGDASAGMLTIWAASVEDTAAMARALWKKRSMFCGMRRSVFQVASERLAPGCG